MKKILIYTTLVIGFSLLMEVFLQLTEVSLPNPIGVDQKVGKILIPDSRINLIKEGLYLGEVNEYGYLGPGYPTERTPGAIRIALMGDSYVEAYQLFEQFNFRTVLENTLNNSESEKFEVLNFGRSGMNFGTMYTYYENYVKQFEPDIVLFVIGGDDFVIKNQNLFPGLKIDNQNNLVFTDGFKNSTLYKLRQKYSYLFGISTFELLKKSAKLVSEGYLLHILFDKLNPEPLFTGKPKKASDVEYTSSPRIDSNSVKILSKIFENFNNDGKTKFAIVARGELDQNYISLIKECEIKYLPLYKYVNSLKTDNFDPNYWKGTNKRGHWNHTTHQFVGEYLAKYLKNEFIN
ncbi:MAG: hypothetical protein SCALA702_03010 [Melioribacteraceae bacterium]|nr:MAG: hypothetical protein SCALA702_03010 [Melioribacteraceae bacterium]